MLVRVESSREGLIIKRPSAPLDMDSMADVGDGEPPKWLSNRV